MIFIQSGYYMIILCKLTYLFCELANKFCKKIAWRDLKAGFIPLGLYSWFCTTGFAQWDLQSRWTEFKICNPFKEKLNQTLSD